MDAKLTRLAHKIAIHLHLVVDSCTICSSRSRQPVWKLLVTSSYIYDVISYKFHTTSRNVCVCVHKCHPVVVLCITDGRTDTHTHTQGEVVLKFMTFCNTITKIGTWFKRYNGGGGGGVAQKTCTRTWSHFNILL
jgi:hypothetical protein